ncbi:MAG: VPLPA-CTERM-specific exosortase XrtD [Nitrospirae bacterium]|nr:MAG: VPLPA-CTERM-specific exosortase XrtD [Nitrospirota bacterium]
MISKLFLGFSAILATVSLGYLYADSLAFLFGYWISSEDYSHGMFVPLISLFLIWQARHRIAEAGIENSWWGLAVISAGLFLYWIGEFATLYVLEHVSLWMVIVGLVIALMGVRGARAIPFPLAYLLTSIPLPVFLYASLSSQLQLWSSALGVGWLQLVGVTAFREGNVIDLGPIQLQVSEACSGIRYLLPLTSLALLCAYLFKDRMWKRVVLVLSSIPISVLVNGFRIGMIGVLVEWYGQGTAEGFYHLFEGWVLFMASLGLLILEMLVLASIGSKGDRSSFLNRFTWVDRSPNPTPGAGLQPLRSPSPSASASLSPSSSTSASLHASHLMVEREEVPPPRAMFIDFPMKLDGWVGTSLTMEKQYIDVLRFDDYVLADYRFDVGQSVNLYVAYYRSQRKGQSAHSPQSCLPGGGWEISSFNSMDLPARSGMVRSLHVNRALIQKDSQKQIVLYWFKQRDRILNNEYLVKFYLFWDALSRGRTDGALVRITSLVGPGETEDIVDQRLLRFVSTIEPELARYVPD